MFVSKLKFTSVFINAKNYYFNVLTNFGVFAWVIKALQPAKVTDMDHSTDTCSKFNKHTIRSNVLYNTVMTASFRELIFNSIPWIFCQLLDRKTHFPCVFIKRYHSCFVLFTKGKEFFSIDWCVSPSNFTYVNKTFYTRHNLKESTVIFNIYYFTFYRFTFFKCFTQGIPRMRSKLFQTKTDTFFIIIKVKYNYVQLLIKMKHFTWVIDTSP